MPAFFPLSVCKFLIPFGESAHDFFFFFTICEPYPVFFGTDRDQIERAKDVLPTLPKLVSAHHDRVAAIGEIGLDYHYDGYDREKQIQLFREQLALADELSMPVIVHSRNATEDTMTLLREYRPKGVVHCFSGSAETAAEVISLGMYIGFTGVITFKNAKKALKALAAVPDDRLLLETDCPYMAPEPFRGKRCDSSLIRFTAEKAAEVRGMDAQELLDITCSNAMTLFGINDR